MDQLNFHTDKTQVARVNEIALETTEKLATECKNFAMVQKEHMELKADEGKKTANMQHKLD
jgi:hypothetical protein